MDYVYGHTDIKCACFDDILIYIYDRRETKIPRCKWTQENLRKVCYKRYNFLYFSSISCKKKKKKIAKKGIRRVANLQAICPRHFEFGLANARVASG